MTKKSYLTPTAAVVEIDNVDVLCTSDIYGGLDDVTRNEIDWPWDQE